MGFSGSLLDTTLHIFCFHKKPLQGFFDDFQYGPNREPGSWEDLSISGGFCVRSAKVKHGKNRRIPEAQTPGRIQKVSLKGVPIKGPLVVRVPN